MSWSSDKKQRLLHACCVGTLTRSRLGSSPQNNSVYLTVAGNAEVPQTEIGLPGLIQEIQNRRCPPLGRFKHGSSYAVKVCPPACHSLTHPTLWQDQHGHFDMPAVSDPPTRHDLLSIPHPQACCQLHCTSVANVSWLTSSHRRCTPRPDVSGCLQVTKHSRRAEYTIRVGRIPLGVIFHQIQHIWLFALHDRSWHPTL